MIQALRAEMGDQLQFVFRNFPLMSIHPFAEYAALAAEAAGNRGSSGKYTISSLKIPARWGTAG